MKKITLKQTVSSTLITQTISTTAVTLNVNRFTVSHTSRSVFLLNLHTYTVSDCMNVLHQCVSVAPLLLLMLLLHLFRAGTALQRKTTISSGQVHTIVSLSLFNVSVYSMFWVLVIRCYLAWTWLQCVTFINIAVWKLLFMDDSLKFVDSFVDVWLVSFDKISDFKQIVSNME